MLAKYKAADGSERWVNIEISQENTIRDEGQRVIFISEVKGATVEEASDPSKMRGDLGLVKVELEGMFGEAARRARMGQKPTVNKRSFVSRISRLLGVDRWEAAALLDELKLAGEYIENGGMIYRL